MIIPEFPFPILFFWSTLTAFCLGSFANVCICRIPQGKSIQRPRSQCPSCRALIAWWQNIPVLSFIFLRGRCFHCQARISWRYPMVEMGFAVAAGVLLIHGRRDLVVFGMGVFLTFYLLVIALIDWDHMIIPDGLSLSLLAAGLLSSPWNPMLGLSVKERFVSAAIGGATGFSLLYAVAYLGEKILRKEALGVGDIKLMTALGAWMGWLGVFYTLFGGSLLGMLWAVPQIFRGKLGRKSYLPFGTFLAAAAWLIWVFHDELLKFSPFSY